MPIITLANGKKFVAAENETILDAALRSGVLLEYSCKTGRCGSCKVELLNGTASMAIEEIGLNRIECENGWILSCCRTATSDIQLNAEDLGDFQLYAAKTLPCRIGSIQHLGDDLLRVNLRLPPAQILQYYPGQYINVIGKQGIRRSYSIANAPSPDNQIELHIRKVPGGMLSHYWFEEAKVNDLLRLNGPLGSFFLRNVAGLDLVFVATGTGMAPIKAMLEAMVSWSQEQLPNSIKIYWGGRVPEDLYWDPTSVRLPLQYSPVLSRADNSWSGFHGYAQKALLASTHNFKKMVVYACGSPAMIESTRDHLEKDGFDIRKFYSDAFVSSSEKKG